MIIFKILQWFLVPSGFIFIFLIVGLILIFRKKRKLKKIGKIFLAVGVALFYIFSITPVADLILSPLENRYQPIEIEDLDKANTVVLLLGGKESDVLRASEVLRIYNLQQMIYNLQSTVIISGDDPLGTQKEEAKNLKAYLIERGISSENIILEDQSRNTKESAENIKKMTGKEPFFLVTSAYHMPRSMEVFKMVDAMSIAAPCDFKKENVYSVLDFFPDAKNIRNADLAFHEYFGIIFYRFSN